MARKLWGDLSRLAGALLLGGCSVFPSQPDIANGGREVAVSVAPGDPGRIVVASESGGLFRSVDGGATWSQTSAKGTFWFNDVKHLPDNADVVIAVANADFRSSNGGGIWRSTNGGASWSQAAIAPPVATCAPTLSAYALTPETARPRVWAATSCGVAYSDDAGASWRFLPTAPGYDNDKAYAVLAPTPTRLVILTATGVKVSTTSGASWTHSSVGLPVNPQAGTHNEIAASPLDPGHLFWSFTYWKWNAGAALWQHQVALYRSWDAGLTWGALLDGSMGVSRPPFVKIGRATDPSHYVIHFSSGECILEHATVTHGAAPTLSAWTTSSIDHCDPADLAFTPADEQTPLLLASDAGLHRTADAGATWIMAGANKKGYAALQVTEVTGQLHLNRRSSDLYFATQDNSIWASPDSGASWPASICCEGFYLNIWRQHLPAAETRLTGVRCGPCSNFISGPLLAGATTFPGPPDTSGAPRLLKPGAYVISTAPAGVADTVFELTRDTGATWAERYRFPEATRDLSHVAGPVTDPVVYTAVKLPGATADGHEIVGIKRVAGTLASGSPLLSNVRGFGSLGTFPTMFAWYKPFGVDPRDANFLIVPDIVGDTVRVSTDAGATWATDTALASLATQGGTLRFRVGQFTQITSFGFDPDCPGHLLVGTQQAGIIESFDRGATWRALAGSDFIPSVSSFYFQGSGQVVISSYGRGLWRADYRCPPRLAPPIREAAVLDGPTIYWKGARIPIGQIHDPDVCPVCGYFITEGGSIQDFELDPASGALREVAIDAGSIRGLTYQRKPVEPPFQVTHASRVGKLGGDRQLRALVKAGERIKGLYLDGAILKGFILSTRDVREAELPRKAALGPYVLVEVQHVSGPGGQEGTLRVVLRGSGFDPHSPISVSVDGQRVQLAAEPRFDDKGNFSVALPPTVDVGGHTVLVEQQGAKGRIRDATTFIISIEDKDGGKREPRRAR